MPLSFFKMISPFVALRPAAADFILNLKSWEGTGVTCDNSVVWNYWTVTINKLLHAWVHYLSASQSLVLKPAMSSAPGNLPDTQTYRPQPRIRNSSGRFSNLCFIKPLAWVWFTFKLENHWLMSGGKIKWECSWLGSCTHRGPVTWLPWRPR